MPNPDSDSVIMLDGQVCFAEALLWGFLRTDGDPDVIQAHVDNWMYMGSTGHCHMFKHKLVRCYVYIPRMDVLS